MGMILVSTGYLKRSHCLRLLHCLINKCGEFITGDFTSFDDETTEIAENAIDNLTDNGEGNHADYDPVAAVLEQEEKEDDLVLA